MIIDHSIVQRGIFILLSIMPFMGFSQEKYDATLRQRLQQIESSGYFSVSITQDDIGRSFPDWDSAVVYYQYDIVYAKGRYYECQMDSVVGKYPPDNSLVWLYCPWNFHPYRFLQDSARVKDLYRELKSGNPMVRLYCFAALAFRKEKGLFEILKENLGDTARVLAMWGDVGANSQVVTVMIYYMKPHLSQQQWKSLLATIRQRHPYVEWERW